MARVSIYHPGLDKHAEVPESTVHIWERSGWTSDRLAQIVKLSEAAGLYDQDRPPSSPAPRDHLAADQGDENPVPEGDDTDPPKEG